MSISPGTRLGAYEVLAPIGAGGMGEVYRARDTRLDRIVAIKVLPAALAGNDELRERFEREARSISSLQHPNICALFDVGESPDASPPAPGIRYLVLEFLEGETLAARITRAGTLQLNEALRVAIEICDALDTAHRAFIVHRDLKPANVFLARNPSGSGLPTAKLLDFGLAKPPAPVVATSSASILPTTPPTLTAQGTILGTFQYMAPEQIEGLEADARTDIFAFGALLFEMLTGRPAFEGKTRATLLGAILKDDPPAVSEIDANLPKALDHVLARCFAKDAADRWQSARDVLHELRWIASGDAATVAPRVPPGTRTAGWKTWAMVAAVAVASIGIGAALTMLWRPDVPAEAVEFTIASPPEATFTTMPGGGSGVAPQIVVSPDGRNVVFVANRPRGFQLWIRPMGSLDAKPLDGTEGASFPFWSPDSRSVGFFAGGKLKKINVAGGPPLILCDAAGGRGGTWSRENVIVFSPGTSGPLQRVSAGGGTPTNASVLDADYGETSHRFPWFLPDGRHFLFVGTVGTCCPARKEGRIRIGVLDRMEAPALLNADSMPVAASGHLFFNRDGTLMAQPFDATSRTLAGDPFPVIEGIAREGSRYASFSVSETGTLVFARGQGRASAVLKWFDRSGRELGTLGQPALYLNVALSADERRVVTAIGSGGATSRHVYAIDTTTAARSRLTFGSGFGDNAPLFSADDQRVVFSSVSQGGNPVLQQQPASGIGTPAVIVESPVTVTASDWTPDGRIIYTTSQGHAGTNDIWIVPASHDEKPLAYLATDSFEGDAVLSPNGKWMAYSSSEGGLGEVYVQSYPVGTGKFQISQGGGVKPLWRRDGKELYFLSPDDRMMAAAVDFSDGFRHSPAVTLFAVETLISGGPVGRQYAVSRDGQRFLVNVPEQQISTLPLTVVLNWLAAVQR